MKSLNLTHQIGINVLGSVVNPIIWHFRIRCHTGLVRCQFISYYKDFSVNPADPAAHRLLIHINYGDKGIKSNVKFYVNETLL